MNSFSKNVMKALSVVFISAMIFSSCNTGSGTTDTPVAAATPAANTPAVTTPAVTTPVVTNPVIGALSGNFIDGPLGGLQFKTSSGANGTTDLNGKYTYNIGDTVEFFLGTQRLGDKVSAAAIVTPLTVCGATSLIDNTPAAQKATNMIKLLLALDTKDNPYGLTLPANINIPKILENDYIEIYNTQKVV